MSPVSSPRLYKGVYAPDSITMPVHEFQGTTSKPLRPSFKRSSGAHSRYRSASPFSELRRAWRRMLSATTLHEAHMSDASTLSRSTYATMVGVCDGFAVPDLVLDVPLVEAFAKEIAHATQMDELVFILHHHVLFVINKAQITLNACEALKRALFVHVDPFVAPRLYDNDALPDLLRALNILLNVVADPNTNVIQSGELFRAGSDSIMDTLGDILMGSPVAYCGANRQQVENLMIAQPCWTLSLGLEGFDPSHDHTVPLCSLPASLFEAERLDSFDDELSPTSPSISDICDAKQTHYFERLNQSTSAANIWSDVTINVEGPGCFHSPTSPISPKEL